MKTKNKKFIKKWEVKTGKNRGYYIACTRPEFDRRFAGTWGILPYENHPGLYFYHKIPKYCVIITHSVWARNTMKKYWKKIKT